MNPLNLEPNSLLLTGLVQDQTHKENLHALFHRKKGEVFQVDEAGKLVIDSSLKGRLHRLGRRFKYCFTCKAAPTSQQIKVQQAVTTALQALDQALQGSKAKKDHRDAAKLLLTKGAMKRMSRFAYDRGAIKEGSHLEKVIRDFSKERQELNAAYAAWKEDRSQQRALETAFMNLAWTELQFSMSLGIELQKVGDGGTGGAKYGLSRFGKKIWVVKPDDEGPFGVNNPRWMNKIKRFFVTQAPCMKGNSEALSEQESYEFDRQFGFRMVPPTTTHFVESRTFFRGKRKFCSLQLFVGGCTTLAERIKVPNWKNEMLPRRLQRWLFNKQKILDPVPVNAMARAAAHNFLIEDLDCHTENLLVHAQDLDNLPEDLHEFFADRKQQTLLSHLFHRENGVAVIKHDGGSSQPHGHPLAFVGTRLKHIFEVLPHFNEKFPKEVQELVHREHGDRVFLELLEAKALRLLETVKELRYQSIAKDIQNEFHQELRRWLFLGDEEAYQRIEDEFVEKTVAEIDKGQLSRSERVALRIRIRGNYHDELKRVRDSIAARIDSWILLKQALDSKGDGQNDPMRALFSVRNSHDFNQSLKAYETHVHEFKRSCKTFVDTQ